MRIAVVTAGLGSPSSTRVLADELAAATRRRLARDGVPVEVDVIELRELAHAMVDHLLTGFPTGALKQALEQVARADGLIAVTPSGGRFERPPWPRWAVPREPPARPATRSPRPSKSSA